MEEEKCPKCGGLMRTPTPTELVIFRDDDVRQLHETMTFCPTCSEKSSKKKSKKKERRKRKWLKEKL